MKIQKEFGSFDAYIWQFVGGEPMLNDWDTHADVPSFTKESELMSEDLKKARIQLCRTNDLLCIYAGNRMVNDHTKGCFLYHGK